MSSLRLFSRRAPQQSRRGHAQKNALSRSV